MNDVNSGVRFLTDTGELLDALRLNYRIISSAFINGVRKLEVHG